MQPHCFTRSTETSSETCSASEALLGPWRATGLGAPSPTLSTGLKVMLSNHCHTPVQAQLTEDPTGSSWPLFTQKTHAEWSGTLILTRNQPVSCMVQKTSKGPRTLKMLKARRETRVMCTALVASWEQRGGSERKNRCQKKTPAKQT